MRVTLEKAIEELRSISGRCDLAVSAPGRLDFLNTHQDYKGLPVVSVGVNLRMYMAGSIRADERIRIISLNLRDEGVEYVDEFPSDKPELRGHRWFGDYFRAIVKALRSRGIEVRGLDVVVNSEVAVAAGLASSAAVEVTFLGLLNEVFDLGLSRKDIAEISYTAEHDIMKIPCGRLDQYGCVFGGILVIYCRPPYDVEEIVKEYNFVVLDSGIRHATADVHPRRQSEIDEGLKILMEDPDVPEDIKKKLGYRYFEPKWEELREDELMPYLDKLPPKSRDRILFTLRVHESTMMALSMLKGEIYTIEEAHQFMRGVSKDAIELAKDAEKKWGSELAIIGLVMNYQHEMLRDLYEVSLPELERIRDAALQAGALGVKISGAGLGGSLIALVPSEKAGDKVLRAGIKAGARRGWVVKIDEGLRREV